MLPLLRFLLQNPLPSANYAATRKSCPVRIVQTVSFSVSNVPAADIPPAKSVMASDIAPAVPVMEQAEAIASVVREQGSLATVIPC